MSDFQTLTAEEKADRMINFLEFLVKADDPAILCHPDGEEQAIRIAKMFPHKIKILKDKDCDVGMIAAADLSKMKIDWRELFRPNVFLKEKPEGFSLIQTLYYGR